MKKITTGLFMLLCAYVQAQTVNIPDAIFKQKLLASGSTNTIAKDLAGNYFSIDVNGDSEIQLSEAANVSYLNLHAPSLGNIFIHDLTGIMSFTNLTELDVRYNRIESININGLQYLHTVNCSNNGQWLDTLILENLPVLNTLICASAGSNTSTPVYTLTNLPVLKILRFGSCRFLASTIANLTALEELSGTFKSTEHVLDLTNKPGLKVVNLGSNDFQTITFAPNNIIEILYVDSNDLTTFDKTLFTNLKELGISWNKLPSLDVSGLATLEFLDCDNASTSFTYNFTSLNVQGCTNLERLICSRNVIGALDLSGLSNLELLDCYGNTDIFTDTGLEVIALQGCNSLKRVIVSGNDYLTSLDLSCSSNYNEIRVQQCDNLQMINLKNGVNESSMTSGGFSYYSSPNLNVIAVDFGESFSFLPATISQTPYYNFTPNCHYNTIEGNVKFDIEGNGCQDNEGIAGIKIEVDCGNGETCYAYTDENGDFTIYTQADTATITPVNELFDLFDFGLTGPVVITFGETILQTIDLCLAPEGIHNNVEVTFIPLDNARPGFDANYKLVYANRGNQIESGEVTLTFADDVTDLISAIPSAAATVENMLTWNFTNLLPFETREIEITLNVNSPMESPAVNNGDILAFTATITIATDEVPDNNIALLNQTVVGSFDPNNKICLEGEDVFPTVIGNYVHYIINFENTGTANAENIVVRDIIDTSMFDLSTLQVLNSSHNVSSRLINNNEAEFIFENIQLPFDDASNDGYVVFKIKTLPALTIGDTFSNDAEIYFDYNYPIYTEEFVSTIQQQPLHSETFDRNTAITLYPNPALDMVHFTTDGTVTGVEVYDVNGRLLIARPVTGNTLDVSCLSTGTYLVIIKTAGGTENVKLLKQ